MSDFSQLYSSQSWSQNQIDEQLNITGRFNRDQFKANNDKLSVKTFRESLQNSEKHIWDLQFFCDRYHLDNMGDDEHDNSTQWETSSGLPDLLMSIVNLEKMNKPDISASNLVITANMLNLSEYAETESKPDFEYKETFEWFDS